VIDVALVVLVVVMMAAIGLELRRDALTALRARRGALLLGLAVNLALVPGVAAWVALQPGLPAGVGAALLLCAAAPGGPAGATFARIARADLAFATALQVSLALAAVVTTPLWIGATSGAGAGAARDLAALLAAVQLAPLLLGMGVRARAPELADRLVGPAARLANLTLLVVVGALVALRYERLGDFSLPAHLALVAPLAALLALGAWRPGPTGDLAMAAALVTSVRNLSVALLVARGPLGGPEVETAVLVASFWMMVLPGGVAVWRGRISG
jgi:BASS family bile acid:Na+ symporter